MLAIKKKLGVINCRYQGNHFLFDKHVGLHVFYLQKAYICINVLVIHTRSCEANITSRLTTQSVNCDCGEPQTMAHGYLMCPAPRIPHHLVKERAKTSAGKWQYIV